MRDIPKQIDDAFYAGQRSADVPLVLNDAVVVTSGLYSGRGGAVISIEAMHPLMAFLVELGDTGEGAVFSLEELRCEEPSG